MKTVSKTSHKRCDRVNDPPLPAELGILPCEPPVDHAVSDSALAVLLAGQSKLLDRLEAMNFQLVSLATENLELRQRLSQVEKDVTSRLDEVSAKQLGFDDTLQQFAEKFKQFEEKHHKLQSAMDSAMGHHLDSRSPSVTAATRGVSNARTVDSSRPMGNSPSPAPPHVAVTTESVLKMIEEENEKQRRKDNFVLHGIPENAGEDVKQQVLRVLPDLDHSALVEVVRLGRVTPTSTDTKPRPILIRTHQQNKLTAFRARSTLRSHDPPIFLNHDLTRAQQSRRRHVVPTFKELRRCGVECFLPFDVIMKDGRPVTESDAANLLRELGAPVPL